MSVVDFCQNKEITVDYDLKKRVASFLYYRQHAKKARVQKRSEASSSGVSAAAPTQPAPSAATTPPLPTTPPVIPPVPTTPTVPTTPPIQTTPSLPITPPIPTTSPIPTTPPIPTTLSVSNIPPASADFAIPYPSLADFSHASPLEPVSFSFSSFDTEELTIMDLTSTMPISG